MLNFNWNIENWINKMLPLERKTPINMSWIKALLSPLQTLQDLFAAKCTDLDFKVKYSAQQKVLGGMLNKLFDPTDKRIYIETISDLVPDVLIDFDDESTDAPLLDFDDESSDGVLLDFDDEEGDYDFNVYVPAALAGDEDKIKSWVRLYSSKRFQIIYI